MSKEYIEREAVVKLAWLADYGDVVNLHDIMDIPAANVVEVVRCGNCRNRYEKNWAKCQGRRPDEFCSDGVSRFKE